MSDSLSTKSTTTTKTTADASLSELEAGSYEVKGTTSTGGTIQARILCQPSGSTVYYQDTRLSTGVLQIDMTKTVQY